MLKKLPVRTALALACAFALQGVAAQTVPVKDEAYPAGPIQVTVDATNLQQRIMRVSQDIPVQPGKLTLLYPAWLPGNHAPRGPIDKIAGIKFTANVSPNTTGTATAQRNGFERAHAEMNISQPTVGKATAQITSSAGRQKTLMPLHTMMATSNNEASNGRHCSS